MSQSPAQMRRRGRRIAVILLVIELVVAAVSFLWLDRVLGIGIAVFAVIQSGVHYAVSQSRAAELETDD